MRAHLGMISLFAVALPLLHSAALGETPVSEKPAGSTGKPKASANAALDAVESYCDAHGHRIAEAPPHPAHAPTASGQTVTRQTSKNAGAAD
jgi:hypothetical protein